MGLLLALQTGSGGSTVNLACPSPVGASISAQAPTLSIDLAATQAALTTAAQAPSLGASLAVPVATSTLSTFAPSLVIGAVLQCPAPTGIATTKPTPALSITLGATNGVVSSATPTPALSSTLSATNGVVSSATFAATRGTSIDGASPVELVTAPRAISLSQSLLALAASIAIVTYAPSLVVGAQLQCPTPTNIATATLAPTVQQTLAVPTAAITTAKPAPTLAQSIALNAPTPVAANLATFAPTLVQGLSLFCPAPTNIATTILAPTVQQILSVPTATLATAKPVASLALSLNAPTATASLTTYAATLPIAQALFCPTPTNVLSSPQGVTLDFKIAAISTGISASGQVASRETSLLAPSPVQIILSTNVPERGTDLNTPVATLVVTGYTPTVAGVGPNIDYAHARTEIIIGEPRNYVLTGSARNYVVDGYTLGEERILTGKTRNYVIVGTARRYTV